MGARPTNVGGGSATPVANGFNDFLLQQLGGQGQSASTQGALNGLNLPSNMPQQMQNQIRQQISNSGQPQQQTNNAFGNAFSGQMNGGNDSSGANAFLSQFFQNGGQGMTAPQQSNPYQNQQYNAPNISQLNQNQFSGNGMADMSGYGNIGPTNTNVMQGFGNNGYQGGQFDSLLSNLFSGSQQNANAGNVGANSVSLGAPANIDMNNPAMQALTAQSDRQRMLGVADMRARFGAEGAGALGTGAQYAEGTLNAEYGPKLALAQHQIMQQMQQQDLAERNSAAQVGLGSAGLGLQGQMANQGAGLQAQGMNMNNMQGLLGSALGARGQDINAHNAGRGMDLSQLSMALGQDQGNQNFAGQQQGMMMQGNLANQGMGNSWNLNTNAANSQNQQLNNQNSLASTGAQNSFNLNNAGQNAQFQQGANQLNSQNFNQGINNMQGMLGLGQQQNAQSNQAIQQMLAQLFGGMQQSNSLGTPQAQTVMQPSALGQLGGAVMGLGGQFLQGGGMGMFNRPQSYPSLPQRDFGVQNTSSWR